MADFFESAGKRQVDEAAKADKIAKARVAYQRKPRPNRKVFSMEFEIEEKQALDELAKELGCSQAFILRQLLKNYLVERKNGVATLM